MLPDFFHCDGKCNTNDGDDQVWWEGGVSALYTDMKTGKTLKEEYVKEHYSDIYGCYSRAGKRLVGSDFSSLDQAKMALCKPFKTLIQNCTIPIREAFTIILPTL